MTIKPIADKEFNKDQDQQDLLFFYTGNDVSFELSLDTIYRYIDIYVYYIGIACS